ncbi:MAG: patatin family protein [Erysipelotrichaceae bacterium]
MNKLGLILEGGGMRGVYTSGVLDYLMEHNIYTDGVIGVSAGSCHATSYISKQYKRNFRVNTKYLKDKRYLSFSSLMKTGSLFGMEMLFDEIPNKLDLYDYDAFNNRTCEFIVTSTNIETGEPDYKVVTDMMKDTPYLQGSCSLPLMARIVEVDGKKLLDGGCSDSIPIQFMRKRGYEYNIVVLTQNETYRKGKNNLLPMIRHNYKEYPNLVKDLETRHIRYNKTLDELNALEKQGHTFIIRPSLPVNISRMEKNLDKLNALYELGYQDTQKVGKELDAFIKKSKQ